MSNMCGEFNRRATKLVRATMEEIQYFLYKNPHIAKHTKILHLLRDPRGRINSYINYINKPSRLKNSMISLVCQRVMKDITIRKELEKQYPNMFMEIHYEDIASRPIEMANRMYQFTYTEDAPENVKTLLKTFTNSTNRPEAKCNFFRKNSTATAFSWEKELETGVREMIESECKSLIDYLTSG